MRKISWVRVKLVRLLVITGTLVLYCGLFLINALQTFSQPVEKPTALFLRWLSFGSSAFVEVMFLAIAIFVWLYARDRCVALLLYCFSCTIAMPFAVQPGATQLPAFGMLAGVGSVLSVPLFSLLVLLFPHRYLTLPWQSHHKLPYPRRRSLSAFLLYSYLLILGLMSIVVSISMMLVYFLSFVPPFWLRDFHLAYFLVGLSGILVIIVASSRRSSSLRAHQQMRLFVCGVVLAVAPLLLLTLLPQALSLPSQYIVNGQFTALSVGIFPISLGYSILRYQILVFDRYIRHAVAWIVGGVCLAGLIYCVVALYEIFFVMKSDTALYLVGAVSIAALLAPFVWWLAKSLTEHLFFSEILHYRRLIDKPTSLVDEMLDLEEASRLLMLAAIHSFETPQVCLFVLEEGNGYYRVYPTLKDDATDGSRRVLIRSLLQVVKPQQKESNIDWLDLQLPVIAQIASARRPLLLSEVARVNDDETPTGLQRYLTSAVPHQGENLLLAPVRAQGKMIGVLVLGERSDSVQYAGPDFEIVQLLLARFSSILETARLYARASQHAALLNSLYRASTMPEYVFKTIEEVAHIYALVAAEAMAAGAEIWLYQEKEKSLRCLVATGSGPRLTQTEQLQISCERDWASWFYEGGASQSWEGPSSLMSACLAQAPHFPCVWLPLHCGEQRLGVLVLTYSRPHFFMKEEMRVLEMFASQCAAALENVRMTIELRAAYERQKELDRLKDQFIMTASHELRTPLTAVQGYIELLREYNHTLSTEARANFIVKAHRGCDELVLMVGNIMDASHVRIDAENIRLRPISLIDSINHVLEILEAMTRREHRIVRVEVPLDTVVMADDMRLRQVLLNLVSNALKYSPAGTNVEITAECRPQQTIVHVRDYGTGVPLEDQHRLFERFMRLDRDMNSPVRGAGLGLYICKQLIEAMGGRIWVESSGQRGEGSIFSFVLRHATGKLHPLPEAAIPQESDLPSPK